jgi:hypothetical protein
MPAFWRVPRGENLAVLPTMPVTTVWPVARSEETLELSEAVESPHAGF